MAIQYNNLLEYSEDELQKILSSKENLYNFLDDTKYLSDYSLLDRLALYSQNIKGTDFLYYNYETWKDKNYFIKKESIGSRLLSQPYNVVFGYKQVRRTKKSEKIELPFEIENEKGYFKYIKENNKLDDIKSLDEYIEKQIETSFKKVFPRYDINRPNLMLEILKVDMLNRFDIHINEDILNKVPLEISSYYKGLHYFERIDEAYNSIYKEVYQFHKRNYPLYLDSEINLRNNWVTKEKELEENIAKYKENDLTKGGIVNEQSNRNKGSEVLSEPSRSFDKRRDEWQKVEIDKRRANQGYSKGDDRRRNDRKLSSQRSKRIPLVNFSRRFLCNRILSRTLRYNNRARRLGRYGDVSNSLQNWTSDRLLRQRVWQDDKRSRDSSKRIYSNRGDIYELSNESRLQQRTDNIRDGRELREDTRRDNRRRETKTNQNIRTSAISKELSTKGMDRSRNDELGNDTIKNINIIDSDKEEVVNSASSFNELKEKIKTLQESNYQDFVKAMISIEYSIEDEKILDNIYNQYMAKDNVSLFNSEFIEEELYIQSERKEDIELEKEKSEKASEEEKEVSQSIKDPEQKLSDIDKKEHTEEQITLFEELNNNLEKFLLYY